MKRRSTFIPVRSTAYYRVRAIVRVAVLVALAWLAVLVIQMFFVMLWAVGGE